MLYQARIHPEQYSNSFNDDQIKRLHNSILSVCTLACEKLADSEQFPESWLMKYRWDKGKKDSNVLPNGEKIVHLKVGGRTSAIVPSVQKKTASVAGDVDSADVSEAEKPGKGTKRKVKSEDAEDDEDQKPAQKKAATKGKGNANGTKAKQDEEDADGGADDLEEAKPKKTKSTPKKAEKPITPGSRRSTRAKAK